MKPTKSELKTILDEHNIWLGDKEKGKRANLSGANLWGAKKSNYELSKVVFFCSNLKYFLFAYTTQSKKKIIEVGCCTYSLDYWRRNLII